MWPFFELPTLTYRRIRGDMIQVYKLLCDENVEGSYDKSVSNILTPSHITHLRGNSKKLFKERCNKDIRKFNFTNRVVDTWNSLPNQVVNSPSINAFKSNLDKHWKDQAVLYDDYSCGITLDNRQAI